MNDETIYFPPGIIDRQGRRLRPGSIVEIANQPNLYEIIGWHVDRILLIDQESGVIIQASKEECRRIDDASFERTTEGKFIIEFSDRPTTLVIGIGTRDITIDGKNFPRNEERQESKMILDDLMNRERSDALSWCREHLRAPIINRVLIEASLPADIDLVVLLVTDQEVAHQQDTVHIGELVRWYLEATGHLLESKIVADDVRWITSINSIVLNSNPHVLDSVMYALRPSLGSWFANGARVAVVGAGGTPAMNYGALISAAVAAQQLQAAPNSVRHIQVPASDGNDNPQPLAEIDIDDSSWWTALQQ